MEFHTGLIEIDWSFLMILINILILYIILKKFFWEKLRGFMVARQDAIKDAFDSAEAQNRRADEKMANYTKRIANVEEEGRQIIKEAKANADKQAQAIIEEARNQASEIIAKAERNIELERAKAMEEMRQEVGEIALMVAEKIVEHEIQNVGQEAIIDEVIENARNSGWQN